MKLRSGTFWWVARITLGLHTLFAVIAWFGLPSRIPTHFGLSGAADNWSSRSLTAWFGLLLGSLGVHALTIVLMSPKLQYLWNFPEKERFLKLTPEQQAPVLELMRSLGGAASSCVTLSMFGLQIGMYLTAHGHAKGLPSYILVFMFVPTLCLLIGLVGWLDKVERAILQASAGC
jgi:uncharacterized membrane protein